MLNASNEMGDLSEEAVTESKEEAISSIKSKSSNTQLNEVKEKYAYYKKGSIGTELY